MDAWVLAVVVAGLAVLVGVAADRGARPTDGAPAAFWLLCALVVVTELFPVHLPRQGETESFTVTNAFVFALFLGWGLPASMVAFAVASAVSDLVQRKPPKKILFNVAQYSLSLAAAEAVYRLLGAGREPFSPGQTPAFIAATLAFFVVNYLLVRVTVALATGVPVRAGLRDDLTYKAWTSSMLMAMAPVALIVANYSAALVPLLLLPVAAVYLACRDAVQAVARKGEAEAAAEAARVLAAEQARLVEIERALVRQLQDNDRLKSDLLASVSHELRTPLTGILGSLVTLSARAGDLTAEQRQELVGMARREGERLKELIEQLLLASRFQSVPSEPAIHPLIDAAEVVRHAGLTGQLDHPGHRVVTAVAGPLPVLAAPEAIAQVLGNLLDNAAKHSREGAAIGVDARREARAVVVTVTDSGPGVPPAERDRIFECFTRLESGPTRPTGGVGLGLYVARQLARAQGGELSVGEPAGGGARFQLRLPLATGLGGGSVAQAAVDRPPANGAEAPAGRAANGRPPLAAGGDRAPTSSLV